MPSSLRIARTDVGCYRHLVADFASLQALHHQLRLTICRHLPEVTASLLALPVPSEDGRSVDWYSDLAGEARPLTSLPAAQRQPIKDKLRDRLRSLKGLADELPRRVRGSEELAASLRAATHYPGDEQVYVVGDEPVITLWGFVRSGRRGRLATPDAAARQARARGRRRLFGGFVLALMALAVAAGYWVAFEREQALSAEIADALAADCVHADRLVLLARRAEWLDPDGERLGTLHDRLAAEKARCAEVERLTDAAAAAGWDCGALSAVAAQLADPLTLQDVGQAPLAAVVAEVQERQAVCASAQRLEDELEERRGDCSAVAALAARPRSEALSEPLALVRDRIAAELALCEDAARLEQELLSATGQCDLLGRLDGRLAERDVSRAPLLAIRERLDVELERCRRADDFSRDLIDAQMDCERIKQLDQRMQGAGMREPPLLQVRERLDDALEACRELDALEQARADPVGVGFRRAGMIAQVNEPDRNNPLIPRWERRMTGATDRSVRRTMRRWARPIAEITADRPS